MVNVFNFIVAIAVVVYSVLRTVYKYLEIIVKGLYTLLKIIVIIILFTCNCVYVVYALSKKVVEFVKVFMNLD